MALVSQLDWVILLGVGGLLLLGPGNRETLRRLGRYYGRLVRLKRDLLGDLYGAAGIAPPAPGQPSSIRQVLLDSPPATSLGVGIPAAVTRAPGFSARYSLASGMLASTRGPATLDWTTTSSDEHVGRLR